MFKNETKINTTSNLRISHINIEDYDYMNFGCSDINNINWGVELFDGVRGIGVDVDYLKVKQAKEQLNTLNLEKHNVVYEDMTNLININLKNKLRFVTAIHFLEHIPSFSNSKDILKTALKISNEFVFVRQPYSDKDIELFKKGLKTFYSDWKGHVNLLTSYDFYKIARTFKEEGLITNFIIFCVGPIRDSSNSAIHPLNSPIDQPSYDEQIHPPKNNSILLEDLYRDICIFFIKDDSIPIEKYMNRIGEKKIIYDSRKEFPLFNNDESNTTAENTIKQIHSLKEELAYKDKQLKSIPQLSCTSYGYSALDGRVTLRNWSGLNSQRTILNDLNGFCENHWLTRYIKHKFSDVDFKINIFFVSNAHDNLTYPMEGKKVLYSPEDLNYRYLEMKQHFNKYALDYVDLAMGFDLVDDSKYIRFPYWLLSHFPPEVTDEQIEKTVNHWNYSNYKKSKNVVAVASHDSWGVRTLIDNDIKNLVDIDYPGKWKNNTSDLINKFNNNKRVYLKQFKFNLCAENVISDGYVTEKIFDAFNSDCIPLYAGGGNYLEPEVINQNAIIRWDFDKVLIEEDERNKQAYYGNMVHSNVKWVSEDDRNADSIELFKNLLNDKKTYEEFKDQNNVLDSSTKYIINKFNELEKHFERLIYD